MANDPSKDDDCPNSTQQIRIAIRQKIEDRRSGEAEAGPIERRSGKDRRGWHAMPGLPFIDGGGVVVTKDRRRVPERRISNIDVRWSSERRREP